MNIINSEIIESKYDTFWEETGLLGTDASPKPVLVMVTGCVANSLEDVQLQKMLEVCKLTAEQYNIIRLDEDRQMAWHQLREQLNPKIIFLIGVSPAQLGISALFKLNEPNNFSGCTWLPTVSLSELEKHQDVKKQLWSGGMKPIFIDNAM